MTDRNSLPEASGSSIPKASSLVSCKTPNTVDPPSSSQEDSFKLLEQKYRDLEQHTLRAKTPSQSLGGASTAAGSAGTSKDGVSPDQPASLARLSLIEQWTDALFEYWEEESKDGKVNDQKGERQDRSSTKREAGAGSIKNDDTVEDEFDEHNPDVDDLPALTRQNSQSFAELSLLPEQFSGLSETPSTSQPSLPLDRRALSALTRANTIANGNEFAGPEHILTRPDLKSRYRIGRVCRKVGRLVRSRIRELCSLRYDDGTEDYAYDEIDDEEWEMMLYVRSVKNRNEATLRRVRTEERVQAQAAAAAAVAAADAMEEERRRERKKNKVGCGGVGNDDLNPNERNDVCRRDNRKEKKLERGDTIREEIGRGRVFGTGQNHISLDRAAKTLDFLESVLDEILTIAGEELAAEDDQTCFGVEK